MTLKCVQLTCNNLSNPIGIANVNPVVSWKLVGDEQAVRQVAYKIEVVQHEPQFLPQHIVLEQEVQTDRCYAVELKLPRLQEREIYYWRVQVCVDTENEQNHWLPWSEIASFEIGLCNEESWVGKWIEADEAFYKLADQHCKKHWKNNPYGTIAQAQSFQDQGLRRVPYLRKNFAVHDAVRKARLYITARGFYEIQLNGIKVGEYALAPDFTAYDKCIYYQTFDIQSLITMGENFFEIMLGDGWFVGHAQGIPGVNHAYGERPALIMQAELELETGEKVIIASDHTYSSFIGPLQYADLFMGEYLELHTEDSTTFGTVERNYSKAVLMPLKGGGIVETEELEATRIFIDSMGRTIVDFGQVIAGKERILLTGNENTVITIEHSEELDQAGEFYNVMPSFPFHDQKNVLSFSKQETIIYEPNFSFQGFRYLRISGLGYELQKQDCKAIVLGSGMPIVGQFTCDNSELNQLMSNILWSQRGNMLSIPTDCPQRERAGFTGDIQVFGRAAALNLDVSVFLLRWLEQCRLEQLERGQIPIVVPYTTAYKMMEPNPGWTSAGWGDVIVFLPWDLYQAYGDLRFLTENYEAMLKWMDYVDQCARETMPEQYYMDFENRFHHKYLWNTGHHWGDWQVPGSDAYEGVAVTKEITASLFYYRASKTMELITKELSDWEKHSYFKELSDNIYCAFHREYIKDGKLAAAEWQGAYVMAITFEMVKDELKEQFAARLNELVVKSDYHLQTGFLSTPYLLETLWSTGYQETAYRVLYQETAPSWLYQVKRGATTVWEEWDGITTEGELKGSSFNHYAFGAVCKFIYERIGGIRPLEKGFKKILIKPEATADLQYAETSFQSNYGEVYVKWEKHDTTISYLINIPHNTTATLSHPGSEIELMSGAHSFELPI